MKSITILYSQNQAQRSEAGPDSTGKEEKISRPNKKNEQKSEKNSFNRRFRPPT